MNLNVVSTEDDKFAEKYPEIMKKIKTKKLLIEPTIVEINEVYKIIIDFIKEKKRKIYGGYALNKLLTHKNAEYALYDETDTPDIDFFSVDPIGDLVNLCDKLHEAGFKHVQGKEAMHKETYSIYVNFQLYCDISYMPSNIYNKVRFLQIDGFNIVHPWFMMIDYFRMFTDPMISFWRLEKHFYRYMKLQKTYPLPQIKVPLEIIGYKENKVSNLIKLFFSKLAESDTIIFVGFYVYNYYLNFSEYGKQNKNYKDVFIPYLEVYSTNYIEDGLAIIQYIKTLPTEIQSRITHSEKYPFFQFYGYNVVFYYNDGVNKIPILYMYSNNKKCIPFKQISSETYNLSSNAKKMINIGSFDMNILHALIILVKIRIDNDNDWNDILYKYINGLVVFRNYYLKKHNKTIYDDTIFEEFVVECVGETIMPERERFLSIQLKKKLGKPYIFRYDPGESKKPNNYVFLNSSGNHINKEINLKLIEKNKNVKIEDEMETEETEETEESDK
jgi:hypothetical protein